MGIVNVTPDSFHDGGQYGDGVRHAESLIDAGADWIDVGGESTRPGALAVDIDTEWNRVRPVIEAFGKMLPVSIDTSKPEVAARALKAGARIINDVTGLSHPQMAAVTADAETTIVMHMRGTPKSMGTLTSYEDLLTDITTWLCERAQLARSESVWIDPGIGFAKTAEQSLRLLRHIDRLVDTPFPVLIGASRKSFIGKILEIDDTKDRLSGSLAAVACAWYKGAQAFRVHDVAETRQLLDLMYAVEGAA
ncbi:MAG: dihydropteroate synthase [Deltaproteobacteria bacterium]|nr:dihydropteroate synthase [Deltaproteobacteria bacterium]